MNPKDIFHQHQNLINPAVKRFMRKNPILIDQMKDIEQFAQIGLWQASEHYIPEKKDFIPYAKYYIEMTILKHAVRDFPNLPIPNRIYTKIKAIEDAESELTMKIGYEPSITEIAQFTHISVDEIRNLREISFRSKLRSLSSSNGTDDPNKYSEEVSYDDVPYRKPEVSNKDISIDLNRIQESWTEEERKIYAMRFKEGLSRRKTAEILKCSPEKVRRIEEKKVKELEAIFGEPFRKRFVR